MGGGSHVLGVRKEILQAIGKTQGDKIKAFFETLSYTHRKKYVN